jgi:putative ABC transport system permease protein
VSISLHERPAIRTASNGGAPARRAVVRWAWRLFRREWRQQLLVLGLLIVAVAGTTAGVAIAPESPSSLDATFGTAGYMLTLPGTDPHLAADISAARNWFGVIDVIVHKNVAIPGSLNTVDLRAQDPYGPFGRAMLRLDSGRYPAGPDQVAVTVGVAAIYRLHVGGTWHQGGHARRIVGLVENPRNLLDNFALVAPGQAQPPSQVIILLNATVARVAAFRPPIGILPLPRPTAGTNFPAVAILVFAAIGLLFVGLVAVAGFTVMAGRRMRAFGMLGAVGATSRHVRLVMIANGAIVGVAAAVAGVAVGLAGWLAFAPHLETITEHRIADFSLPWWDVAAGMLMAVVTAIAAASWPARTAAQIPVVAALSGRPPRPQPGHRFAALGGLFLAAGLGMLTLCKHGRIPSLTIAGLLATGFGILLLGPLAIRGLAAAGQHSSIAVRLALRDLARYQARSGAALAAVSLILGIAAAIAISAAESQASAATPPAGGNLPPNQLIVYLSPNADASLGTGNPIPALSAAKLSAMQADVYAFAGGLRAQAPLVLDVAYAAKAPHISTGQGVSGIQAATLLKGSHVTVNGKPGYMFAPPANAGLLYVATPAILRHYGIKLSQVGPAVDILTSLIGLSGYQLADFANQVACPGGAPGCAIHHRALRQAGELGGIVHPTLQRVGLPAYTSDPNMLITMHAVRTLGLNLLQAGWLIQTPRPLTAAQVIAADHWAAATGLTIETRNVPAQANLSRLATEATAVGALLALGVLAMTIGLIRSETAADLRTLTATGASGTTRRTLTAATAASLALLGALTGTVGAYLAMIAWNRGVHELAHVPVVNLAILIVGLPAVAMAASWLLAGREPAAIARQPLV